MKTKLTLALAQAALIVGCAAPVPALANQQICNSMTNAGAIYHMQLRNNTQTEAQIRAKIDKEKFAAPLKAVALDNLKYAAANPMQPLPLVMQAMYNNCIRKF